MPSLDPVVTGEPLCICGRSSVVPHCPKCGSRQGYAIKRSTRRQIGDGTFAEFTVRRCRMCNLYYDDWQWQNECAAPEFISDRRRAIMAQAKAVDETLKELRPDEKRAIDKYKQGQATDADRMAALRALFPSTKRSVESKLASKLSQDDVAEIWNEDDDKEGHE